MWILEDLFKWRKLKRRVELNVKRALMVIKDSKIDIFKIEDARIEDENRVVTISLGIKVDLENLPLHKIRVYFRGVRVNENPLFTHWKIEEEFEIDRDEVKKRKFNIYIPKTNKGSIKQKYQQLAEMLMEYLVKASKSRRVKTKLGYLWDFKIELAKKQLERGDILWCLICDECWYRSIILNPLNECPWCGSKSVKCQKIKISDLEIIEE